MKKFPRHEPEVIRCIAAKKRHGNEEKVATTAAVLLIDHRIRGVRIESGYRKASELETLREMARSLPERWIGRVHSIFCDSRFGRMYTIDLTPWDTRLAYEIAKFVEQIAIERDGGHDGVWVGGDDGDAYVVLVGDSLKAVQPAG